MIPEQGQVPQAWPFLPSSDPRLTAHPRPGRNAGGSPRWSDSFSFTVLLPPCSSHDSLQQQAHPSDCSPETSAHWKSSHSSLQGRQGYRMGSPGPISNEGPIHGLREPVNSPWHKEAAPLLRTHWWCQEAVVGGNAMPGASEMCRTQCPVPRGRSGRASLIHGNVLRNEKLLVTKKQLKIKGDYSRTSLLALRRPIFSPGKAEKLMTKLRVWMTAAARPAPGSASLSSGSQWRL